MGYKKNPGAPEVVLYILLSCIIEFGDARFCRGLPP